MLENQVSFLSLHSPLSLSGPTRWSKAPSYPPSLWEGRKVLGFYVAFQQLSSYRDKIETQNWEEIPFPL